MENKIKDFFENMEKPTNGKEVIDMLELIVGSSVHSVVAGELDIDKLIFMWEEGLKSVLKTAKDTDPAVIIYKLKLILLYEEYGEYARAAEILEGLIEPAWVCLAERPELMYRFESKLGTIYQYMGCYEKAEKIFREVIDSAGKRFDPAHNTVLENQANLAVVCRLSGRFEKAVALLERTLDVVKKKYGESDHNVAIIEIALGLNNKDLGRYEEAIKLLAKSKKAIVAAVGKEDPSAIFADENFVNVLRDGMRSGDSYCLDLGKKLNVVLPEK